MSFVTKGLLINHCLRRFSLYCPINELRLGRSQYYYLNNLSPFQSKLLNEQNFKGPAGFYVPERKFMNSHFGYVIKRKIEDVYDTVRYLGRTEERLLGFKWFRTLEKLNYKEFLNLLELPDTFYSWFKIMELHTWMLLLNLPQKTRGDKVTRISLIDAMWIDTQKRCEILAPHNKNFKKNMRSLYQRFQVTLFLYDDAYFNNDRELTSAVWYNIFEKENVDPRLIEVLVSYIRYQVNYISNLNLTPEKVNGDFQLWTPLTPHYVNIFKGLLLFQAQELRRYITPNTVFVRFKPLLRQLMYVLSGYLES